MYDKYNFISEIKETRKNGISEKLHELNTWCIVSLKSTSSITYSDPLRIDIDELDYSSQLSFVNFNIPFHFQIGKSMRGEGESD